MAKYLTNWQFWVSVVVVIVGWRFLENSVPQIKSITGGV